MPSHSFARGATPGNRRPRLRRGRGKSAKRASKGSGEGWKCLRHLGDLRFAPVTVRRRWRGAGACGVPCVSPCHKERKEGVSPWIFRVLAASAALPFGRAAFGSHGGEPK